METAHHEGIYWRRLDTGRIEKWDSLANEWRVWEPTMGDPPAEFLGPVRTPPRSTAPPPPAPPSSRARLSNVGRGHLGLARVGLGVLILLGGFLFRSCPEEGQPFSATNVTYSSRGDDDLIVSLLLKNEGTTTTQGECTVTAFAGGTEVGTVVVSSPFELQPGSAISQHGTMHVENGSAIAVDRVELGDCRESL